MNTQYEEGLTGHDLNFAVALRLKTTITEFDQKWKKTGPLIDQYGISIVREGTRMYRAFHMGQRAMTTTFGTTALIAACRCLVEMES